MENTQQSVETRNDQHHFPIQVVDRAFRNQHLDGPATGGLQLMLDHFAKNWQTQIEDGQEPGVIIRDIDAAVAAMIQIRKISAKQIEAWDPVLSATSQMVTNLNYYALHLPKEFEALTDKCENWLSTCRPYVEEPYGTSLINGRHILKEAIAILAEIVKTVNARTDDTFALENARQTLNLSTTRHS